jgi:hypothetical protein
MTMLTTTLRRGLLMLLIGATGGAVWSWMRSRGAAGSSATAPEWPPLTTVGGVTAGPAVVDTSTTIVTPTESDPDPDDVTPGTQTSGSNTTTTTTTSIVNALIDAPEARSDQAAGTWQSPNDDGSCPDTHPIKANDNSGIYHVPGGRFYDRTKAERCYRSEAAAEADGYRRAKS